MCQNANIARSTCTTMGFNLSKKYKLKLHQTQIGDYVDRIIPLYILLGANCTTIGETHLNTIELASWLYIYIYIYIYIYMRTQEVCAKRLDVERWHVKCL